MKAFQQMAAVAAPAAGAATDQVVAATLSAMAVTLAFVWLVARYRSGGAAWLRRAAVWAERDTGLPIWAALPGMALGNSLLVAVIGMYWDIAIHIDDGRDPGPLANPAHYLILAGLFGVLFSGALGAALTDDERPSPSALRLPNGWWAPLGSVMIVSCGAVSLIAFPLDDLWHRLFGQDVTLWGPTHLLLIGGAAFSVIGHWVLQSEGERARALTRRGISAGGKRPRRARILLAVRDYGLSGGLLAAFCAFQAEFDFGVPQFRLVWHPLLLALSAAFCLVAARLRNGRGGALGTVAAFLVLRGLLSLIVGPILGHTTPHIPIFVVEALIVEAVAMRWGSSRPIALGLASGVLIGTCGFAAQYLLSRIDFNPWPPSLFAEGLACALVIGTAGGVLGAALGRAVSPAASVERVPRGLLAAAGVAVAVTMAWAVPMPPADPQPSARISLVDAATAGHSGRWATVTAALKPPDAAVDARLFNVTAWQGGGSVVTPMETIAPGVYRSAQPVPVHGDGWKSMLRLQDGRSISALPIYMPADPVIPAAAVPAPAIFTRSFETDAKAFQREQKEGVQGWLRLSGYGVVLLIWLAMVSLVCWGVSRLRSRWSGASPGARKAPDSPTRAGVAIA